MKIIHQSHTAVYTYAEFNGLCENYPSKAPVLNQLVTYLTPSKAVIYIDSLTPEVREKIGNRLCDTIYQKAYSGAYYLKIFVFLSYYQTKSVMSTGQIQCNSDWPIS